MKFRRPTTRAAVNVAHQIFHIGLRTPAIVADVFVQYHAHIDRLEVQIHPRGWVAGQPAKRSLMIEMEAVALTHLRDQIIEDLKTLNHGRDLEPLPIQSPFFYDEKWARDALDVL